MVFGQLIIGFERCFCGKLELVSAIAGHPVTQYINDPHDCRIMPAESGRGSVQEAPSIRLRRAPLNQEDPLKRGCLNWFGSLNSYNIVQQVVR